MCSLDDRSARRRLDESPLAPLACSRVATGVDPLPPGPLGTVLDLDLDLLLLDEGGTVAVPPADDVCPRGFSPARMQSY